MTTSVTFEYRKTGEGIFQVDAGGIHLGTVQQFGSHEWWAYPANNPDQKSFTLATREEAAKALLAYVQAAPAGEVR